MEIESGTGWLNPWQFGTLLYDLENDPDQLSPMVNDEVETRMAQLLVDLLRASDAPATQFKRLGLPESGDIGPEHLLVRAQQGRAIALAEDLPVIDDLPYAEVLRTPIAQLVENPLLRSTITEFLPEFDHTEIVAASPVMSIADLAAHAFITAKAMTSLGVALNKLLNKDS